MRNLNLKSKTAFDKIDNPPDFSLNNNAVRIMNNTGSILPKYSIVGITRVAPAFRNSDNDYINFSALNSPVFIAEFYDAEKHSPHQIAVLKDKIDNKKCGIGYVSGSCWARVKLNSVEDKYCNPVTVIGEGEPGEPELSYLETAANGSIPIVYIEKSEDDESELETGSFVFALVKLGGAGAGIGLYKIDVARFDYLECRAFVYDEDGEGVSIGETVYIAKPYELRILQLDGQTINNWTYEKIITNSAIRNVTINSIKRRQIQCPREYAAGNLIYAANVPTGPIKHWDSVNSIIVDFETYFSEEDRDGRKISGIDLNVAGRHFMNFEANMFPIELTQTGGAQGAPPTWTYTVKDAVTGLQLGTAVNPTASPHRYVRPAYYMDAADYGTAYFNTSGTLSIMWINEKAQTLVCE